MRWYLEETVKYLCLVYHDKHKLDALSKSEHAAFLAETLAYDEELRASGHYVASHSIECAETATTIRVWNDLMTITSGPFAEADKQLGGYILIDARDLNEAIRVVSRMPLARMGVIELRAVKEPVLR
jgi:hypothetical protein